VIGETESGNVTAISDGIAVVVDNDIIAGVDIKDGTYCAQNSSDGMYNKRSMFKHVSLLFQYQFSKCKDTELSNRKLLQF